VGVLGPGARIIPVRHADVIATAGQSGTRNSAQVFVRAASDHLFRNEDGNRLTGKQYYEKFPEIVELARDAGVPIPEKLRPHDLRRTCSTNEIEKNPQAYRKVLRNLGHTYPSSAAPYLIATDADVEDEQGDLIDIFVNPHIEKWGTK
jgi:integrase